jgi:hypothetical protein
MCCQEGCFVRQAIRNGGMAGAELGVAADRGPRGWFRGLASPWPPAAELCVRLGWRLHGWTLRGLGPSTGARHCRANPRCGRGSPGPPGSVGLRAAGSLGSAGAARPCVPDRCGGKGFPGCHPPTQSSPKATGRRFGTRSFSGAGPPSRTLRCSEPGAHSRSQQGDRSSAPGR